MSRIVSIDTPLQVTDKDLDVIAKQLKKIEKENWLEDSTNKTLICTHCKELKHLKAEIPKQPGPRLGVVDLDQSKKRILFTIKHHEESEVYLKVIKTLKKIGSVAERDQHNIEASRTHSGRFIRICSGQVWKL